MKALHTLISLAPWQFVLVELAVSVCVLSPPARAAEPVPARRVYIAMDDHPDYMWSADEAYYRQAFLEMIDFYLEEIERTAGRPKSEQCRWNCDGSLWMWTYEKNKENFSSPHTWSFSFKVDNPDIWHEEVGAVIRAKLLGDGGHYSARNARDDWLTLNHYADVSNQGAGLTLSNADCSFMRLGRSTLKELDASTSQLSVLAGGDVSGAALKITNQGRR